MVNEGRVGTGVGVWSLGFCLCFLSLTILFVAAEIPFSPLR